jgi:hypothetical protein
MTTTIYGSSIADTILSTACKMATNSGGTETSVTTTIPSTSQPYAEFRSQGGSSTAVASLPAPTGNGWVWWCGAGSIAAGNWSAIATNSSVSKGVSTTIRFYKISSSFAYTAIGTITVTQTATGKTSYTYSATAMGSVTTSSGDGIYVDRFWFDNNANAGSDNPVNYVSNSATAGVVNDMQVTFPTFTPASTQTTKDVVMRGLVSQQIQKDIALRGLISQQIAKDIAMRGNVGVPPVQKDITVRGRISQQIQKDIALRGRISQQTIKDILMRGRPADTSTKDVVLRARLAQTISKDIILRGNVGGTSRKDVVMRGNVSQTTMGRDIVMRGKISGPRIASGGFTLFANGTGTVSFASDFRATQYPDPALSLAPVLDRLGSSSISWNSVTPTGTTAGMKTSTDGINFTTATNGSAIPGLTGQSDPIIDIFDGDGTATYTNTCKSGGSVATVTQDTANKRLMLTGGSSAVYLNSSVVDDDIDLICDMDESDAGGLVWRYQDASNYYELGCYDDSSTSGFTSQLRLYKVLAGTRSLLGSASAVTWHRSTEGFSPYKRTRVTMLGSVITVYFDGQVMQTYTDASPLGAGKVGLRNDGGTSRYYQLRVQQQGDYVSGTPAGDVVTGKFIYLEQDLATTDPSVGPQVLDTTISARSPNIATGALITQLHDPTKPFATKYSDEMVSLAQASGDYWWDADQETGETLFAQRQAIPAPFCLYSTDFLNKPATQSAGGTSGVQPTNSADTYRNQQIITNTISLVTVTGEEKIANGTDTSWNLAYPLYSAPTITVGGVVKTVGQKGIDTGKDLYWQPGNNTISQDSGAAKIPSGYVFSFSYVGQYADQVIENNLAEQAARQAVEGGTGIVVDIVDGLGMLSSNAVTYAQGLLARNGNNDTVSLIATTTRPGLAQGMVVPVFLPEFGLNNRQLLIMRLTASGYQKADGTTFYEYTIMATDGPNLSNWAAALGF